MTIETLRNSPYRMDRLSRPGPSDEIRLSDVARTDYLAMEEDIEDLLIASAAATRVGNRPLASFQRLDEFLAEVAESPLSK